MSEPTDSVATAAGVSADIEVIEVADARFLFGDLFHRSFACPIADFPRHYIAFSHLGEQNFKALGYLHKTEREDYSLLGGLCVDPGVMRGGIGTALMRKAIEDTDPSRTQAIFAYTQHPVSLGVSLKVGMQKTSHDGLIVYWCADLSEDRKTQLIQSATQELPF